MIEVYCWRQGYHRGGLTQVGGWLEAMVRNKKAPIKASGVSGENKVSTLKGICREVK
jgi:hypothetical protein